jgi:T5orf172 domain-containing protein
MAKSPKASALVDTRVIYCGDDFDQLRKLPEGCVNLIYIDPPFNSNRNYEKNVSPARTWGETKEKRTFEDRQGSTRGLHRTHVRGVCRLERRGGGVTNLSPSPYERAMGEIEYIYILFNQSIPGLVKIGKTERDPDERAREFSQATGVATPFEVGYAAAFADCDVAERYLHAVLEHNGIAA